LNNANIRSLIAFVEEINHALHAALQFKQGDHAIESEDYARNLELQARVDTYLVLLLFVAFFRKTQKVSRTDRRWLRFHLFASQNPGAFRCENLRGRYLETTELASSYTQYLDTLNGLRRLDEIRMFRSLDYPGKKTHVLAFDGCEAQPLATTSRCGRSAGKREIFHCLWDSVCEAARASLLMRRCSA
jgi:hypothetical protein